MTIHKKLIAACYEAPSAHSACLVFQTLLRLGEINKLAARKPITRVVSFVADGEAVLQSNDFPSIDMPVQPT